ncbi:hypothetical protein RJ640_018176 [Escallonia rubra]|uniref:Sulfotransferase n=1 Tax=Escallonia rubra TaxID=112253 RepID=A0AA88UAN1_9ASTE|nr:hypothetical protein RJ640_018176 [Escallonia rubra]
MQVETAKPVTSMTPNTSQSSLLPKYLEEDELTEEFKELLSSLPRERGWVVPHIYKYHGVWHTPAQLRGVLALHQHFQAQDSDILLVTTPKSGTTWLKSIMFALMNRSRYPKSEQHPLLKTNPHVLVPFLEIKLYANKELPDLASFVSPRLFCTHLSCTTLPNSARDSACKIVYLCRNPRDTFVSLFHFSNKLRTPNLPPNSIEEVFDMFCEGASVYGPFWDHVLGYWKESLRKPQKVFFLKYEEMKEQPTLHLKRLAEFLGCPFSKVEEKEGVVGDILELCSFGNMSNLVVNRGGRLESGEEHSAYFRKGEVGDWKNYMTEEMVQRLEKISEQKFKGSGLCL